MQEDLTFGLHTTSLDNSHSDDMEMEEAPPSPVTWNLSFPKRLGIANDLRDDLAELRTPLGSPQDDVAFVFGLDDTTVCDDQLKEGVSESVDLLFRLNIPFVFLNNGDGFDHIEKAKTVRKHVPSQPEHFVVLELKPFHYMIGFLGSLNRNVLIIGGCPSDAETIQLARRYGFANAYTPATLAGRHNISMSCVMIWSNSDDWGRDVRLIDSLRKTNPKLLIFLCDDDFDRATHYRYQQHGEPVPSAAVIEHMMRDQCEGDSFTKETREKEEEDDDGTDDDDDDEHDRRMPFRFAWQDRSAQNPPIDTGRPLLYGLLEDMIAGILRRKNAAWRSREAGAGAGAGAGPRPLATPARPRRIYVLTDRPLRDLKRRELRQHLSHEHDPEWKVVDIQDSHPSLNSRRAAGQEDDYYPAVGVVEGAREYRADGWYKDILDAVLGILSGEGLLKLRPPL